MRVLLGLLTLLMVWLPAAAVAVGPPVAPLAAPAVAPSAPAAAPGGEPAAAPAVLRYFNREIATFRAAYYGFQPAERAANSVERIGRVLAKGGPGVVRTAQDPEGLTFTIDGVYVFRILNRDLDADDGETFDQARTVITGRLEAALAAARHVLRGEELLRAVGLGFGATLALGLAVWALGRGRLWLRVRLAAALVRWLRLTDQDGAAMFRVLRGFGQPVFLLLVAALVEEWLRLVFGLIPYTQPWGEELTRYVANLVRQVTAAIVDTLPGLVMVAVIVFLAHVVIQGVRALAEGIERGRFQLLGIDADLAAPARRLLIAVVWLFALALAYPYLPGASGDAFKGVTVLVGLMVSLGASGLVSQAASGFILTFSRSLRDGDWVRIGEAEGAVIRVGVFSTKVRPPTGEEISIPNTVVLATTTKNYSRPPSGDVSLLETSVTIGYNAPWRQVHAMLKEAAARTPALEREPEPEVLQVALSDFYVQYSLRARLRDQSRRAATLSLLNSHIQDVFNEYGVQIMSPHYRSDPRVPVVVPKERWYDPPAPVPRDAAPQPQDGAPRGGADALRARTE